MNEKQTLPNRLTGFHLRKDWVTLSKTKSKPSKFPFSRMWCSLKEAVLKNFAKSTCALIFFWERESSTSAFLWILRNKNPFFMKPTLDDVACFKNLICSLTKSLTLYDVNVWQVNKGSESWKKCINQFTQNSYKEIDIKSNKTAYQPYVYGTELLNNKRSHTFFKTFFFWKPYKNRFVNAQLNGE